MRTDIFHPDFKAAPWWWEAWHPNNALSQDPPANDQPVACRERMGLAPYVSTHPVCSLS